MPESEQRCRSESRCCGRVFIVFELLVGDTSGVKQNRREMSFVERTYSEISWIRTFLFWGEG